jgi:integrase
MTADQIISARLAAHAAGRPSRALAYAIAYETTLRLWDVIGQWWPLDQGGMSDVIDAERKRKWFGLKWEDIDEDLVLRFKPSKTDEKTGKTIIFPLSKAPMVLEEMAYWPKKRRRGPVIISEETGIPYHDRTFDRGWAKDRKAAGIDVDVWARDLRAAGISEGRAGAATLDDTAKVAGHSSTRTTAVVYDRANLEAAERFADARIESRKTKR